MYKNACMYGAKVLTADAEEPKGGSRYYLIVHGDRPFPLVLVQHRGWWLCYVHVFGKLSEKASFATTLDYMLEDEPKEEEKEKEGE